MINRTDDINFLFFRKQTIEKFFAKYPQAQEYFWLNLINKFRDSKFQEIARLAGTSTSAVSQHTKKYQKHYAIKTSKADKRAKILNLSETGKKRLKALEEELAKGNWEY